MTDQAVLRHLRLLKRKRDAIFTEIQTTAALIGSTQPGTSDNFLARCGVIDDLRKEFRDIQNAILDKNEDARTEDQLSVEKESLDFDNIFFRIKAVKASLNRVMTSESANTSNGSELTVNSVRLPKINIPVWDGNMDTFQNFFSLFNSIVHESLIHAPTVKLTYLRALLRGRPLQMIENLELSAENYEIAYNKIKNTYDNVRVRATHHLKKMFDFAPLASESVPDLTRFLEVFQTNYQAYRNLTLPHHYDFMMFVWAISRLPTNLRILFDRSLDGDDVTPTFAQLVEFVDQQCRIKEQNVQLSSPSKPKPAAKKSLQSLLVTPRTVEPKGVSKAGRIGDSKKDCPRCRSGHSLQNCPEYLALPHAVKKEFLTRLERCEKCLGPHDSSLCSSTGRCSVCRSSKHHRTLHDSSQAVSTLPSPGSPVATSSPLSSRGESSDAITTTLLTGLKSPAQKHTVLLATAQALLRDSRGSWTPIRLVIDGGSMVNLISADCVQRLGLKINRRSVPIYGALQQQVGTTDGSVTCVLASHREPSTTLLAHALVVKSVCSDLPTCSIPQDVYNKYHSLDLADKCFHMTGKVDFLLGAALYSSIFQPGYSVLHGEPAAIETIFGWVVLGRSPAVITEPEVAFTGLICGLTLDEMVQRFWQSEEVVSVKCTDPADQIVETHFVNTVSRQSTGRYVVRLPFNESQPTQFGLSKEIAIKRWYNLESKLKNNPKLRLAYHEFLTEYLRLGHMAPATEPGVYYIPHFAVLRDSTSSPVRVVFDGGCKDSLGLSINDRLLAGPPLQKDITVVIQHFRLHHYAVTADIKMMYRQILLHPKDRCYQHIFWRSSTDQPLQEFELRTVTYGLKCAPYQAQRVLLDLAEHDGKNFPLAAKALKEACYMDDCCFSLPSKAQALQFRHELTALLLRAGFELRKWASNCEDIVADLPEEHRASQVSLRAECTPTLHILGIQWNPREDNFSYVVEWDIDAKTKRRVLSKVASIFDPLGWVAPVVFWAKVFLRELWTRQLDWDTELPPEIISRWVAFAEQLPSLSKVSIPRLCTLSNATQVQLIGFCDASELGYAAALYIRSSVDGMVTMRLIKAKTKVAPLNVQTVQRLELNGALLLSKLVDSMDFLQTSLNITECILFTDSSTVLAWLRTPPHRLKTYVANRVVRILELTDLATWRHVPSSLNAADCASRGLSPAAILNYQLWWDGPSFIRQPMDEWPPAQPQASSVQALAEMKPTPTVSLNVTGRPSQRYDNLHQIISKFSTLSRLQRVMTWILRFVHNTRRGKNDRACGTLSTTELRTALQFCLKVTQLHYFAEDLKAISKGKACSKPLRRLLPFVGEDGLLRVGGRLQQSFLPTDAKHPVILPKHAPISALIIDACHRRLLHAGPQAVQALVQQEFWIVSARSLIRQRIWQCLACHKMKAKLNHPVMADLPASRVRPSRPFSLTSVDMAGPLLIKESTRRNASVHKCWFAVFVCLSTKAAHLELVTSLTTEAFQAALDRFVARRGLCHKIYCDNGTNFVGSANELREVRNFLRNSEPSLASYLALRDMEFIFNPPDAPWMGGLWEAAVKSAKRHLAILTTSRALTFEELSTLLCRIEAVMNSRPLCRILPQPPDSLDVLTPGHFLIGQPLTSPPEVDLLQEPENHLSRWQHIQRVTQAFWKRWTQEYLHTLTVRPKWSLPRAPLAVGDPVFVMSEHTKPLEWPLARVEELFPGNDGVARKARVRTSRGSYVRPIAKLVSLPPAEPPNPPQ